MMMKFAVRPEPSGLVRVEIIFPPQTRPSDGPILNTIFQGANISVSCLAAHVAVGVGRGAAAAPPD